MSLFLTFVNTKRYKKNHVFHDPLELQSWWDEIASSYDLPIKVVPEENERLILVTIREFLIEQLEVIISGEDLNEKASQEINDLLSLSTVNYQLEKVEGSLRLAIVNHSSEMNQLIQMIVLSFLELTIMSDKRRIKACHNPDCHWYFYDDSKNSSRKWCDGTCRSLMKVRAFRKRKTLEVSERM